MRPGALETLNTPLSPLLPWSDHHSPRAMSPAVRRSSRSGRENAPPADPNVQKVSFPASPAVLKKSPTRVRNPRKIVHEENPAEDATKEPSDSSVQVVVRIRPSHAPGKEEEGIAKVSGDSLVVGGRTFTFSSVLGPETTQEDIFQAVGLPLVKNSMSGFNTSILSYGETGSGKTYTMWGPLSSMVEDNSINTCQGIAPRIFHMLFQEIQKKQDPAVEKQISFQCRCSFLEIHNEQINDLLDPSQRNLQMKDDTKNGFYIENLTEEFVTTVQDVTQIIVKGLSSRRVGATSINSKSSRSHIILTCVIESWCKGTSAKAFSSSKISRISLVDLAGSDRNKLNDADRHCIKEGRHILKSLSSLGNLVNILAEVSHSGKQQSIPYRDSCLTHLLRESLGGNAKVAFICTVSPDARCKSGTLSTLRFAQRAKCIQNKAIVNEITEDYVNDLSDQIRHLKEELIRERSYQDNPLGDPNGFFRGDKARQSLNLLRVSLNHSLLALPYMDNDSEEEVDISEEDVSQLCEQLGDLHSVLEEKPNTILEHNKHTHVSSIQLNSGTDNRNSRVIDDSFNFECKNGACMEECCLDKMNGKPVLGKSINGNKMDNHPTQEELPKVEEESQLHQSLSSIDPSVLPSCSPLPVLREPTLSESPKASNSVQKDMEDLSNLPGGMRYGPVSPSRKETSSVKNTEHIRLSLQSKKLGPTDSLAISLQRGLQVIEYHQRNSSSKRTTLAFSFDHLIAKPREATELADVDTQASLNKEPLLSSSNATFICMSCRQREIDSNMQIIPISEVRNSEDSKNHLLENSREYLTDIISRKNELEKICEEQATKINQLNILIMHYKNEHEGNSTMKQSEGTEELQHENYNTSADDESKKHSDVPKAGTRLRECQRALDNESKFASMVVSSDDSLLQLIRNGQVHSSSHEESEDFEKERQRWTESESRWISLTEELRIDLESHRRLAEKRDSELVLEKKCSAELDDALQRAILGHARIIEHYAELQEQHNDLVERHKRVMEGVAQVKKAAAKAGAKGAGSAFAEALAAELSTLRVEREKEIAYLKKQNKGLRIQLKDTAEAVHAAGELLVRLREAEEAVLMAEAKSEKAQQEIEKLRKQMEKLKKKHAMEMVTVKHYMAESRLPESALEPLFRADGTKETTSTVADDDQSWRSAFVPSYG